MSEQLAAQWPQLEVEFSTGALQYPSNTFLGPTWQTRLVPLEQKLTEVVEDTIAATDTTPAMRVRVYTPKGDNLPLVVFFHGGGYIAGIYIAQATRSVFRGPG